MLDVTLPSIWSSLSQCLLRGFDSDRSRFHFDYWLSNCTHFTDFGFVLSENYSYQQLLPSPWHQNISGRNNKIKRRSWYDLMRFLVCTNSYIVSFSSSFFKLGHSVHGFAGGKGPVLTAIDLVTLSIFFGSSLGDIEVPWDLDSFVWPSCWV